MQGFKTLGNLKEDIPNFRFGNQCALLLAINDTLEEVAMVDVFHNDASNKPVVYHNELLL
jgi:hypothetical protein